MKRAVFNKNIGDRRIINKVHKNKDKFIWREPDTEMDNHSDTHYFGANFRPISFTSEECTVSPFLPEYVKQMNVPICTCVTSLTLDSGEVVILEFGQGLWFGNIMEKSHDKSLYEIEYPDGMTEQLADNIIADNVLSQE